MQRFQGFWRRLLDRVRNADQAGDRTVDRDEHDGFALLATIIRRLRQIGCCETQLFKQASIAKRHSPTINPTDHALARDRFKVLRLGKFQSFFQRALDNSLCQRVFGSSLQTSGQSK